MAFEMSRAQPFIDRVWDDEIVPKLMEYIKIPNKSPHFDAQWQQHGYMDQAVELIADWCGRQEIAGMTLDVVRLEGRTPLIFMEIPGQSDDCILLYGHLDKQPEMSGWASDLGPWKPVLKDAKLYGRGGADDGYAAFASLTAILAVQRQQCPHARCVVIIEACEESGSFDLPHYIEHLRDRIGEPSLVICLDSGAGNYEQLWITTSLRGNLTGTLTAEVLREGVHSGYASGIVPSSFRILRRVLSRLEDETTGRVLPEFLHCEIPAERRDQTEHVAALLGDQVFTSFPFAGQTRPMGENNFERLLGRNWRPSVSITGAAGLPDVADAGNVLRPSTSLKISLRLPPLVDGEEARVALKSLLERDPPYGASVRFKADPAANGWNAPAVAPWLAESLSAASRDAYGNDAMYMGEGGTIPFMAMLGESFPDAQFVITGVLGPASNAHGPNEFLHIPFAKKLTNCVAKVIVDHQLRAT